MIKQDGKLSRQSFGRSGHKPLSVGIYYYKFNAHMLYGRVNILDVVTKHSDYMANKNEHKVNKKEDEDNPINRICRD